MYIFFLCFISWAWQKHGHKKTIPLSKREVKQGAKSMLMEPKNLVMEQLLEKAQAILLYVWEKEKKKKINVVITRTFTYVHGTK